MDARQDAAHALFRVQQEKGFASQMLTGPRRGAETALVYGALRRRGTLDAVLSTYSTRKLALIKPETLAVLRVALFEMLFLDDAPAHAVVQAAVENAKSFQRYKDLGFVNAILRQIVRSSKRVPFNEATDLRRVLPRESFAILFRRSVFPDRNHDVAAFLAARASTARWIAARRESELGFDRALACLELQASTPSTHIRPAPGSRADVEAALEREGIAYSPGPHADLLTLPPSQRVGPVFEACGQWVVVQDAVASRVAPFVDPPRGGRILDFCAAPGGKAVHLAQLIGPEGSLTAWDNNADRLERVAENAGRLGLDWLSCGRAEGEYDAVLVDAPCSNTGVLARRPEARWRVRERHLPGLAQRQLRILKDASAHVRPGGTLVYSTCSLEPEENGGVVAGFLERGGFVLDRALTVRPDEGAGDGGFMVRMTRV